MTTASSGVKNKFSEPWSVDGDGDLVDRFGMFVPLGLPETRQRIIACVSACAGIPTDLLTRAAFMETVQRAAKVLQLNPPQGGNSEQASQSGQGANGAEPPRPWQTEVEEIVERVLVRHGVRPRPIPAPPLRPRRRIGGAR
jgi:hypothetical protein